MRFLAPYRVILFSLTLVFAGCTDDEPQPSDDIAEDEETDLVGDADQIRDEDLPCDGGTCDPDGAAPSVQCSKVTGSAECAYPGSCVNIVFVGVGMPSVETVQLEAERSTTSDEWGALLSWEPFASNRERFSVWVVDRMVEYTGEPAYLRESVEPLAQQCGLPNLQVVALMGEHVRSGGWDGFIRLRLHEEPSAVLAHEFGHAYWQRPCIPIASDVNIGTGCEAGTGCYQACAGASNWFKSTLDSMMRNVGSEFNAVSIRALCRRMYEVTGAVGGVCCDPEHRDHLPTDAC